MMQGAGNVTVVPRKHTGNKNLFRFLVTVDPVSRLLSGRRPLIARSEVAEGYNAEYGTG